MPSGRPRPSRPDVIHGKGSSSDDSDPGVVFRLAEVTEPEMHVCAERLLNSHSLANAPSQREFLRFVIAETMAGRGRDLKEYVIGVAVLGRPDSFDPRTDASVRVAARRLRQKIDEYYAGEGQADEVRLALERGGYAPRFELYVEPREQLARAAHFAPFLKLGND